jgi:hypothetical protein
MSIGVIAALAGCLFGLMSSGLALAESSSKTDASHGGTAAPAQVLPDPGDLTGYRGQSVTLVFTVTGTTEGSVWGTGIYTDDSRLAAAAVHAGVVSPGETANLTVEVLPGQASYQGAASHGVVSADYGGWDGSYKFLDKPKAADANEVLPDPGNLKAYSAQLGQSFHFEVTGATGGSVWGDGVYTDDSQLASAAVHAGVIKAGKTGVVIVKILPGQDSYGGATRNGVESSTYGSWNASYQFVDASGKAIKPSAN